MPASPTSESIAWRPEMDEYHPSLVQAMAAAARFAGEVQGGGPARWITLSGITGSGKTFLARQLYRELRKHREAGTKDWPAQTGVYDERARRPFYRWLDEAEFARLIFDDKQYDLPEYIAHEWLVAYDDLGTKTMGTRDAQAGLNDAIMRLANQRIGKWTIWTTNLSLDEISARIDPRVASRLIRDGNRFVTITAGDYALRRNQR